MSYHNMNTGLRPRRRRDGGTTAAMGTVLGAGREGVVTEGAARKGQETVNARTFLAAAVLLAIDAHFNKRDAVAAAVGKGGEA